MNKVLAILVAIITINSFAGTVIIKKGDTVSKIASDTCSTVSEIQKLNPGLNINKIKVGQKINVPDLDMDRLFSAFVFVESKGNDLAEGDAGKAVGCLQMWKIMVDEVNRLCHTNYTYQDRTDRAKCKAMFVALMHAKHVTTVMGAVRVWNPKHSGKAYRNAYINKK